MQTGAPTGIVAALLIRNLVLVWANRWHPFAVVLVLAGCGGDGQVSTPPTPPPPAAGPNTPAPAPAATMLLPSAPLAERRAQLDRFWGQWKSVYLSQGCGGAYVDTSGDNKPTYGGSAAETLTVSEAHGYGMLALVLMAGRDAQAKALFEGMNAFFLAHPSATGPGLMAWNQTRDCKDAPDGGDMSATDGDLDIALAL